MKATRVQVEHPVTEERSPEVEYRSARADIQVQRRLDDIGESTRNRTLKIRGTPRAIENADIKRRAAVRKESFNTDGPGRG